MSKVIVFGSHGNVGQRLIKLFAQTEKYQATAVIRNSKQAETITDLSNSATNIATTELDLGNSLSKSLPKSSRDIMPWF